MAQCCHKIAQLEPTVPPIALATIAVLAIAILTLIIFLVKAHRRESTATHRCAVLEEKASRLPELEEKNFNLQSDNSNFEKKLAETQAILEQERKGTEEKLTLLTDAQKALSDAFKAASGEALKNNSESFLKLAKSTLDHYQKDAESTLDQRTKAVDALVKPIIESLDKVDTKIQLLFA